MDFLEDRRQLDKADRRFLSQGRVVPCTATEPARALFQLCGLAVAPQCDAPVAAVQMLAHPGHATSQWCLRCDPVYLHPRRHELILMTGPEIDPDPQESLQLLEDLVPIAADHGAELRVVGRHWFWCRDREAAICTFAPAECAGRNIDEFMPRGKEAMAWRTLLNELQMQLAVCPVNRRREEDDRLPLNSLWFWGGGRVPSATQSNTKYMFSTDDPLIQGLARLTGADWRPLQDLLRAPQSGHRSLCIWGAGSDAWLDWRESLLTDRDRQRQYVSNQLADFQRLLRRRQIEEVTLFDPMAGSLTVRSGDLSPWRRLVPKFRK